MIIKIKTKTSFYSLDTWFPILVLHLLNTSEDQNKTSIYLTSFKRNRYIVAISNKHDDLTLYLMI